MDTTDQLMDEDDIMRGLEWLIPLRGRTSEFSWGAECPPSEPLPVDDPVETPRAQGRKGEFGSTGSSSKEEYDDYWSTRVPIQEGMCSSRFHITGRGHLPLCPRINPTRRGVRTRVVTVRVTQSAPKQSDGRNKTRQSLCLRHAKASKHVGMCIQRNMNPQPDLRWGMKMSPIPTKM